MFFMSKYSLDMNIYDFCKRKAKLKTDDDVHNSLKVYYSILVTYINMKNLMQRLIVEILYETADRFCKTQEQSKTYLRHF